MGVVLRGVRAAGSSRVLDVRLAGGLVDAVVDPGDRDLVRVGDEVLAGGVVLPGLVDSHVHWAQWAQTRRRVDVGAARSPEEAAAIMAAAAGPDLVVGHGYRAATWSSAPHKDLLERAVPGAALALVSDDVHAVWCSPAALVRLGREHPTGVLREQESLAVQRELTTVGPEVVDRWVAAAGEEAARRGLTGIVDFEHDDTRAAWTRRAAAGPLPLRVVAAVWEPWLDGAGRTGDVLADLVTVGPFKILADGSLNTRTAACHHPYPDPADGHGALNLEPGDLRDLMARARAAGLHPAVHAIGDRANAAVLDAFAQVGGPVRVEHAQLVAREDVARFAGTTASIQPQHATTDRDVAEHHWPEVTARAFPYADLAAAGARLLLGSDAPVSPPDPWAAIADAVARTDDDRPPWHPEQALDRATAIHAACGGRDALRLGDPADLVVLGADPYEVDLATLRTVPVLATILAGRLTHRVA